MAMGLERAHAEFLGQGEGLAVVRFGQCALQGIAMRCNIAEEPQGPRLASPLLVRVGEIKGTIGQRDRILYATG